MVEIFSLVESCESFLRILNPLRVISDKLEKLLKVLVGNFRDNEAIFNENLIANLVSSFLDGESEIKTILLELNALAIKLRHEIQQSVSTAIDVISMEFRDEDISRPSVTMRQLWPIKCFPGRNPAFILREEKVKAVNDTIDIGKPSKTILSKICRPEISNDINDFSTDNVDINIMDNEIQVRSSKKPKICFLVGENAAVGKTEILKEVCHRSLFSGKFQVVGWINCTSSATIRISFRKLYHRICRSDPSLLNLTSCTSPSTSFRYHRQVPTKADSQQTTVNTSKSDSNVNFINITIKWLERLLLPWMLVYDDVSGQVDFASIPFPRVKNAEVHGVVLIAGRLLAVDGNGNGASNTNKKTALEILANLFDEENDQIKSINSIKLGAMVEREAFAIAERTFTNTCVTTVSKSLLALLSYNPTAICQSYILLKYLKNRRVQLTPAILQRSSEDPSITTTTTTSSGVAAAAAAAAADSPTAVDYLSWIEETRPTIDSVLLADSCLLPGRSMTSDRRACIISFVISLHIIADFPDARIKSMRRCLEYLCCCCCCGVGVKLGWLDQWLQLPYSPLTVHLTNKWRLVEFVRGAGGAGKSSKSPLLLPQDAEFELEVESVRPVRTSEGIRYKWRVYRKYSQFREAYESCRSYFSEDISNVHFPSSTFSSSNAAASTTSATTSGNIEDIVNGKRIELSQFMNALSQSRCWGDVCQIEKMSAFLGFESLHFQSSKEIIYNDKDCFVSSLDYTFLCGAPLVTPPPSTTDPGTASSTIWNPAEKEVLSGIHFVLELLSPLLACGILVYTGRAKETDINGEEVEEDHDITISWNQEIQCAARSWLFCIDRLEDAVKDSLFFLQQLFIFEYSQYIQNNKADPCSCEQLLPHIFTALSIPSKYKYQWNDFQLFATVYSFSLDVQGGGGWNDGLDQSGVRRDGLDQSGARGDESDQSGARCDGLDQSGARGDESDQSGARGDGSDQSGVRGDGSDQSGVRGDGLDQSGARCDGELWLLEQAETCARHCIELIKDRNSSSLEKEEEGVGSILDAVWHANLGDVYNKLKRLPQAREMYEYSLAVYRKRASSVPHNDPSILTCILQLIEKIVDIAYIDYELNNNNSNNASDALESGVALVKLREEALYISRRIHGKNHIQVAPRLYNLANVLQLVHPEDSAVLAQCLRLRRDELGIVREVCGEFSVEAARSLNKIGELQRKSGRDAKARKTFETCLEILVKTEGPQSPELVTPLFNLGVSLHTDSKYEEARRVYQKALEIVRHEYGHWHLDSANLYDSLGVLLSEQGKYEEALPYLEKALAMYRRIHCQRHREVAASLNNIAYVWRCLDQHETARKLYFESLEILRHMSDPISLETIAQTLNALGESSVVLQRPEEARTLFLEALGLRIHLFGDLHKDTATVLRNLSILAYSQSNFEEAREMCESALIALRAVHGGRKHEQIAETVGQLAEIHRCLGSSKSECSALYEESLEMTMELLGPEHPRVALQLNNMAAMLYSHGEFLESRVKYEESLAVLKNHYGKDHVAVAASINNLAEVLHKLGDTNKAIALHRDCLAIRVKLLGEMHSDVGTSLHQLGQLLLHQNRPAEARQVCQRSLTIRRAVLGSGHSSVAEVLLTIGKILTRQGDLSRAESCLREALSLREALDRQTLAQLNVCLDASGLNYSSMSSTNTSITITTTSNSTRAVDTTTVLPITFIGHSAYAILKTAEVLDTLVTLLLLSVESFEFEDLTAIPSPQEQHQETSKTAAVSPVNGEGSSSISSSSKDTVAMSPPVDPRKPLSIQEAEQIRDQKLAQAQRLIETSLLLRRMVLGEDHEEVATNFTDLATVYLRRDKVHISFDLHSIARSIRETLFGDSHPATIVSINDIGRTLRLTGRLEECRTLYEQCVRGFRVYFQESHPTVAAAMMHLADVLRLLEEYDEADELFETALSIRHRVYGERHPLVAASLHCWGELCLSTGNLKQAISLFYQAWNIRKGVTDSEEGMATSKQLQVDLALTLDCLLCSMRGEAVNRQMRGGQTVDMALSFAVTGSSTGSGDAVISILDIEECTEKAMRAVFHCNLKGNRLAKEQLLLANMLVVRSKYKEAKRCLELSLRLLVFAAAAAKEGAEGGLSMLRVEALSKLIIVLRYLNMIKEADVLETELDKERNRIDSRTAAAAASAAEGIIISTNACTESSASLNRSSLSAAFAASDSSLLTSNKME